MLPMPPRGQPSMVSIKKGKRAGECIPRHREEGGTRTNRMSGEKGSRFDEKEPGAGRRVPSHQARRRFTMTTKVSTREHKVANVVEIVRGNLRVDVRGHRRPGRSCPP